MADDAMPLEPVAAERQSIVTRPGESRSLFIVFLELFFSRWMLICGIFFAASFWSYVTLARAPDTYEGSAQILIRRGKVQSIQELPVLRQQEEVGSEVDILLSNTVLDETARLLVQKVKAGGVTDGGAQPLIFGTFPSARPHNPLRLADLPLTDLAMLRKYLKSQIQIRKFGESNVIEVSLISVNPAFAAEAVNTLIDVYEKFNLQVERSPGQSAYFRLEIESLDREINEYQSQLATYMENHGVANLDKERELVTLRRHGVQVELDKLQMDKAALDTDLRAINNPATRLQAAFLRNDQAIFKMRENIAIREAQVAELRSKSTADNPLFKQKQLELDELRKNLLVEEELAIAQQRHLYLQVQDKERELNQKIASLDAQLSQYPRMEADVDRLDREIKQRTLKRIDVVEKMVRASTLENPDETMNKVKVLGYAQVPSFSREARKGFKFLVAVMLSMITAFVAAVFVEGLDHSVRRREEIEEKLDVPYLASLSTHHH